MSASTSVFDEVKLRVELSDYLTEHAGVELSPDGANRYAACCPFHEEDTPSFKVTESRDGSPWKTWYCFGACQTGGTVIDAVMRQENFGTAFEAVEYLNDLYGLELQHDKERYERFKKTVAEATQVIERTKVEMASGSKAAKDAAAFLHRRGLDDETIAYFEMAVDTSRTRAGRLTIPIYDRANHPITVSHRAMFDSFPCAVCKEPVKAKDVHSRRFKAKDAVRRGNEVPFDWKACPHCGSPEARIAWLADQHPKYMNERDFEKSRLLYNEHHARGALREPESLGYVLVEGYGDVWAAHMAGQRAVSSYNGAVISEWQASEAARLCLAQTPEKPIILVPDFDSTGLRNVRENIKNIRAVSPAVEIQVVHSLVPADGKGQFKDLGELLQARGPEVTAAVLHDARISADEWMIRELVEATNPKTGEPFHSKNRQIELVAEVLNNVRHRTSLDHLAGYLSEAWTIPEAEGRRFLHLNLPSGEQVSSQHLMKTIGQAHQEAVAYLQNDFVIPHGFEQIDRCFPGGGARTRQLAMFLGKSGTGKTMLTTQLLANMARQGIRSIFFSLEQPAGQLYMRIACQTLDVRMDEAFEMIKADDPRLAEIDALFENMVIVDNVPESVEDIREMTPQEVMRIIQEVNMTRFPEPAQVIAIDHLGIMAVPEDAPRSVKNDDMQAAGYIMQELFKVTKMMDVYTMVLQQLPKEVRAGVELASDSGRGGSKQTDYCDYIFGIWRPEQAEGLDDADKVALEGRYKLKLAKNRHGASVIANLYFDKKNLRITPALDIMAPQGDHAGIDGQGVEEGEAVRIEVGAAAADSETIVDLDDVSPDPSVPNDSKSILDMLGGAVGGEDTFAGMDADYFSS